MKILFLIFFLCLATHSHGWTATGVIPEDKKIGHPNQCWDEEIGYIKSGETKRLPTQCVDFICQANGEYVLHGCGNEYIDPPCEIVEGDLSKPYPDCCSEILCPDSDKKIIQRRYT